MVDDASRDCRVHIIEAQTFRRKIQEHSAILNSYTSLISNQTRGYKDTFFRARNIKFELGECSCGSITKQSVCDYGGHKSPSLSWGASRMGNRWKFASNFRV